MTSPGRNGPDHPDRDDASKAAPEWSDPEWRGPGSRGRYRDRQPSGREPLTARSPLRLRAILSGIALVVTAAAAVLFAVTAQREGDGGLWTVAALCAAITVVAAIDLIVIAHRRTRA